MRFYRFHFGEVSLEEHTERRQIRCQLAPSRFNISPDRLLRLTGVAQDARCLSARLANDHFCLSVGMLFGLLPKLLRDH
jgi:hypothetical protein